MNPKKNKSMVLLSTQEDLPAIDDGTSEPEIVTNNKSTKIEVDAFDHVVRYYSCKGLPNGEQWLLFQFF